MVTQDVDVVSVAEMPVAEAAPVLFSATDSVAESPGRIGPAEGVRVAVTVPV